MLLSSSSVFPEPTAAAFEMAATVGYDGVEVMVWTDAVSQDAGALKGLADHYDVPVLSVHAPLSASSSHWFIAGTPGGNSGGRPA